jgi:hypothetical protein
LPSLLATALIKNCTFRYLDHVLFSTELNCQMSFTRCVLGTN